MGDFFFFFFFSLGVRENFGLFGGGLLMYAPQRESRHY